jgi:hypothetical protein
MKKTTKASTVMGLLKKGYTPREIKDRMAVSDSYIYSIKKLMKAGVETTVETPKPGEFVQADTNVDAILDTRATTYGSFEDVANVAQEFKNIAYDSLKARQKTIYADQAEALDMIFSKIARIVNGNPNYVDSWTDIAGYATLVADRLQGKIR